MFRTIGDVKRANERAGLYFFEPATMRFFHSRIGQTLYGGRYFVTSECREPYQYVDVRGNLQPATPRLYTVREAKPDGSIETIGEFQEYETRAQAIGAIRRLLESVTV